MIQHLPFSNSKHSALGRLIERSAQQANVTDYHMAWLMTYFLDTLTRMVCEGEAITIPGVGQFAPFLWHSKKKPDHPGVVVPRFQSALCFKQQVMTCCLRANAKNIPVSNYKKTNATPIDRPLTSARSFTALGAFRDRIMAQARRNLIDATLAG